jgi:pimeloyl-ACP methyl ester carboxylesterase
MDHKTLTVNGLRLHYTVTGAGPDIVFVHGWASSRRMWAGFLPQLGRHFRCWTLDLPGFGDSEKPAPGWYSIPNFTHTVLAFMHQRGFETTRLVGHSMGGMIVLNLAARHPVAVERLVAINPVVTGRANLRPLARPEYSQRVLDWVLRLSPGVTQPLLSHPLGHRLGGLSYIRRRTEDFAKGTAESLLQSGRAVVSYDVAPLLDRIAASTLVIVGDRDVNVPASEGRLAAARIPGATLRVVHAGHLPTDDRPAEILRTLQGFLA